MEIQDVEKLGSIETLSYLIIKDNEEYEVVAQRNITLVGDIEQESFDIVNIEKDGETIKDFENFLTDKEREEVFNFIKRWQGYP